MKCIIEKLDHQGRGIAFIDGKITFVENALPGEELEIQITNEKKKFKEAIVKKRITISNDRIEPKCPYYNECGGCNLLHLNYKNQLNYKENKIKDILKRYADIDYVEKIIPSEENFNYRNKVTLKVDKKLGYFKRKSNDIVYINECKLVQKNINKIIKDLNEINEFNNVYEVIIRNVNSTDVAITYYLHKDSSFPLTNEYIRKNGYKFNKIIKNNTCKINQESKIIGKLSNFNFVISPLAFFQVNTKQTEKLYNKVIEYLEPSKEDIIMDLYCGTGTIGMYASPYVKKVIGVEICKEAIEDAKTNLKINNINNMEFICGDTELVIKKFKDKFDSIIVDPPRSGLTNSVINDIFRLDPNKIVYLSCDPITLARDLKILKEKYNVEKITPVDMFPNTYHVETIVMLSKR
jgi:23S rRNA (uracil1939-C5)-methyltransferase